MNVVKVVIVGIIIAVGIKGRAESLLTDSKLESIKPRQVLSYLKDGKPVYKCQLVALNENKAGTGLNFKKVKKSKDILTVSFVPKDVQELLDSKNVYKCNEVEVNVKTNGLSFSNK